MATFAMSMDDDFKKDFEAVCSRRHALTDAEN